ncbi:two-component response regulator [Cupriavidus sp. TA19]|uniref:response regulator transcription factor n=1 Tax=unclassified Cupriavidus TaxID=2640874 RepID=UPI000E2EDF67|nr:MULTISPECIES: response regulator [unclassified Cupriavidus]BDB28891.1 response regulator [Cupriavidus sp. P-10]GLC97514.1 two-component response regulator [Cupriavidus sp. TA19]
MTVHTIAIVDDDESVLQAIGRLVRSLGYEVELFASGRQLLESEGLSHINCVITDVEMPCMDGLELSQCLRRIGHAAPIIFISGVVDAGYEERARTTVNACFLSKPFAEQDLIDCIELALYPPPLR